MLRERDYYKLLGLQRSATAEDIKREYHSSELRKKMKNVRRRKREKRMRKKKEKLYFFSDI